MMTITESNPSFFKPLSGKNGKIVEHSIVSLYGATFGDDFAVDDTISRDMVRNIISLVIQQIPWQEDEEASVQDDIQKANYVINKLVECGWIEFITDMSMAKKIFTFTRNGKKAAQFLYSVSHEDDRKIRQRNVRMTRASLESYEKTKDPEHLVDAIDASKHIVSDLMDNINDVREEKGHLVALARKSVEEAGEEFIDFFDRRFSSDIGVKFGEDSAIMHKLSITAVVNKLISSDELEMMEQKFIRSFPRYKKYQNPVRESLETIKSRLISACDSKLPQLKNEFYSYVKRGESILRKTNSLINNQNRDLERLACLLKESDTEKRMSILEAIGDQVNIVNLKVLNISNITLRKNIKREPVETYIEDPAPPTKEAYIQSQYELRKSASFSFTEEDRISYIKKYLDETGRISNASFEIGSPNELLSALFSTDVAYSRKDEYVISPQGRQTKNLYFTAEEFIIERKK